MDLITPRAWQELRIIVLKRDNYTCTYCGCSKPVMCVDHIMPLSRNGTNNMDNLTTACRSCNSSKRNRTPEEWGRKETVISHRYERFDVKPMRYIPYKELKKIKATLKKNKISLDEFCYKAGLSKYTHKYINHGIKYKMRLGCQDKIYNKLMVAYQELKI